MKIIKIFPMLLIILCLSCKKYGYVVISADVGIKVLNAQGQDLLNSPVIYDKNNIVVTLFKNGQAQQFNGSTDKGFLLGKDASGLKILKVFLTLPNPVTKERSTVTLIQFGTAKPDTIRAEFEINGESTVCTKAWFNGVLKVKRTPGPTNFDRSFSIVK
jgi:hypothetical protein